VHGLKKLHAVGWSALLHHRIMMQLGASCSSAHWNAVQRISAVI
jgi:hypothetical protein